MFFRRRRGCGFGCLVLLALGSWPAMAADTSPPTYPSSIHVTKLSCRKVLFTWDACRDLGSGLENYYLTRETAAGARVELGPHAGGAPPFVNQLRRQVLEVEDRRFRIGVRAVDRAGNSSRIDWSTFVDMPEYGFSACLDQTPLAAPPHAQVRMDGTNCASTVVSWTYPPAGSDLAGFHVYRDGVRIDDLDATGRSTHDSFGLVRGQTYRYEVRAVDASGLESSSAVVAMTVPETCPGVRSSRSVDLVGVRFPGGEEPGFTMNDAVRGLFRPAHSREPSIPRYFTEVSYGTTTFRLATARGWYTLPHPAADYCESQTSNGRWSTCDDDAILRDLEETQGLTFRGDVVILFIAGSNDQKTGGNRIKLHGAGPITSQLAVAVHELSHTFGVEHSGAWQVPGYGNAGPNVRDPAFGSLFLDEYGDSYSVLGHSQLTHPPAFTKQLMGFLLPRNAQTIRENGIYTLGRLEDVGGSAIKELRVPVRTEVNAHGAKAPFYSIEYRTPRGYDGPRQGSGPAPFDGLVVRLVPHVFPSVESNTLFVAKLTRTGEPLFYDPYNRVGIALISSDGTNAQVRICGIDTDCPPSVRPESPVTPGLGVAPQDN